MKRGKQIPGRRTSKIEYSGCLNTETQLVFFKSTSLLPPEKGGMQTFTLNFWADLKTKRKENKFFSC